MIFYYKSCRIQCVPYAKVFIFISFLSIYILYLVFSIYIISRPFQGSCKLLKWRALLSILDACRSPGCAFVWLWQQQVKTWKMPAKRDWVLMTLKWMFWNTWCNLLTLRNASYEVGFCKLLPLLNHKISWFSKEDVIMDVIAGNHTHYCIICNCNRQKSRKIH